MQPLTLHRCSPFISLHFELILRLGFPVIGYGMIKKLNYYNLALGSHSLLRLLNLFWLCTSPPTTSRPQRQLLSELSCHLLFFLAFGFRAILLATLVLFGSLVPWLRRVWPLVSNDKLVWRFAPVWALALKRPMSSTFGHLVVLKTHTDEPDEATTASRKARDTYFFRRRHRSGTKQNLITALKPNS